MNFFRTEHGFRGTIDNMDDRKIIDYLAGRRRQLNISQEELGRRIGMSRNHIGRMERHVINPTFGVVVRICEALDISLVLQEKPEQD